MGAESWLATIRRHGLESQISSALERRELMEDGVAPASGQVAGRLWAEQGNAREGLKRVGQKA